MVYRYIIICIYFKIITPEPHERRYCIQVYPFYYSLYISQCQRWSYFSAVYCGKNNRMRCGVIPERNETAYYHLNSWGERCNSGNLACLGEFNFGIYRTPWEKCTQQETLIKVIPETASVCASRPHMQCMACTLEHTMQAACLIYQKFSIPGNEEEVFSRLREIQSPLMNIFGLALELKLRWHTFPLFVYQLICCAPLGCLSIYGGGKFMESRSWYWKH
jgi:hypothetical protein